MTQELLNREIIETSFDSTGMFSRRIQRRDKNGSTAGACLLMIHGLGESSFNFERTICDPRFSNHEILSPDLLGYGKSTWPEKPPTMEEHAQVLHKYLANQKITTPVVLVGHSMGGVIGLIFAEKYPHQVCGFINVEGNISPPDCTVSARAVQMGRDKFLHGGFDIMREEIFEAAKSHLGFKTYYSSFSICDPRTYYLNSQELVSESATRMLAERLSKLSCPQIYILGAPEGTGKESQDLLTKAGLNFVTVQNAGHWPFVDQPTEFRTAVSDFLSRLEPKN